MILEEVISWGHGYMISSTHPTLNQNEYDQGPLLTNRWKYIEAKIYSFIGARRLLIW